MTTENPPNSPDRDRPTLVVLCGPAGAGKTTWAQDRFPEDRIVSSDECRRRLTGDPGRQDANQAAFTLFHVTLALRLALGRSCVADSTALEPGPRRRLLTLGREAGSETVLVLLDLPPSVCRRRNATRERRVPEAVLDDQFRLLDRAREAVEGEGWDRVVRIGSAEALENLVVQLP